MPFHTASTFPALAEAVQINVELDNSGLRFDAEQRYTLRYGIG